MLGPLLVRVERSSGDVGRVHDVLSAKHRVVERKRFDVEDVGCEFVPDGDPIEAVNDVKRLVENVRP